MDKRNNLIDLRNRPAEERKAIASLGGYYSGKVRQEKAIKKAYYYYFLEKEKALDEINRVFSSYNTESVTDLPLYQQKRIQVLINRTNRRKRKYLNAREHYSRFYIKP